MHLRRDPACGTQAVQADEAGGVVLVVGLGRVGFHRGALLGFLRRQFADEGPRNLGGLPIVVMNKEAFMTFLIHFHPFNLSLRRNLVRLADGGVGFEK